MTSKVAGISESRICGLSEGAPHCPAPNFEDRGFSLAGLSQDDLFLGRSHLQFEPGEAKRTYTDGLRAQHPLVASSGNKLFPGSNPVTLLTEGTKRSWSHLTGFLFSTGRGDTFTINCSGFDQHGVDLTAFQAVFDRKAFRPVVNYSIPTHVNISFTLSAILEVDAQLQLMTSFLWLNVIWYNPFIRWNPEECGGIRKLSMTTENLWLPDIFIKEFMNVDQTSTGLMTYVNSEGRIKYDKPMQVVSICNLDIFYFPFDQQNCTLTFGSFIYTVEDMVLGMEKEVQEISNTSLNLIQSNGEWVLLNIHQRAKKMTVDTKQYDQIIFYVAIRRRSRLYVINLLAPSGFLVAIDTLSFYLPAESGNRVPFKMTLLLGYNVFLLMMNDLLPATGTPLISVYFALCLSLMVVSLLETIFITYLLHLTTTEPPPMPQWLHSLLLHCTSPRKCSLTIPQKRNKGLGPTSTHPPGLKEPEVLAGKMPNHGEAELNGCPESTRTQQEHEARKQCLVDLWVQFSHIMDTLLFCLYLLLMASSIITVIVLWNT
ncbi:5-hydroxytryptamine receptor 3C-like [Orycteropus afer afer]|uniref:5-hydroxytryptamine receptor 3C-like n=1 Tax=Orycteropus afer afer TaxID=1230840 RepID=A0A8B6ZEW1_ORYAF|nr:5-hydroxytryptamine receptor 3C-like [Orycteropus afer afer]